MSEPWNSDRCDPLSDIKNMISFAQRQTKHTYRIVKITEPMFEMLKSGVNLKTKKEIEKKYFEIYNEVIKIEVI